MIVLVLISFGLAGLITLVRPQVGAILIWFAIWLYPNSLLYGTLPLNVRFDDLWVVYVFLVCLVWGGIRQRIGTATWLALAWTFSILLGGVAGVFVLGGVYEEAIKAAGKALYVPLTALILSNLLQQEGALRKHLAWFVLAGAVAGLLGILMLYQPRQFEAFMIPKYQLGMTAEKIVEAKDVIARRAQGALGIMTLATVSLNTGLLSLCLLIHHPRQRGRIFFGVTSCVCLVSLAFTVARGAIGGFLLAVLWAIIFTRRRKALIVVVVLASIAILLEGSIIERIMLRITGQWSYTETSLEHGFSGRLRILQVFSENLAPSQVIFGIGMSSTRWMYEATVHNTYLGAFVYTGIIGVIVLGAIVARAAITGRRVARGNTDWLSQALGTYLLMLLIAMLVNGFVLENFQRPTMVQPFFAAMVFVERRLAYLQQQGYWANSRDVSLPESAAAGAWYGQRF